jgi:hypothetical protein
MLPPGGRNWQLIYPIFLKFAETDDDLDLELDGSQNLKNSGEKCFLSKNVQNIDLAKVWTLFCKSLET